MPGQRPLDAAGRRPPVIDFDYHSQAYTETWIDDANWRLAHAPVAWTEAHGGHWVIARHADALAGVEDWRTFSSENGDPERPYLKGVVIPASAWKLSLNESDPPEHQKLRLSEAPFFAPKPVQEWAKVAETHCREALDAVAARGACDLVNDVIIPTTAATSMEMVGAEPGRWRDFALAADGVLYRKLGDPDYPVEGVKAVEARTLALLEARRAAPRHDIASALAHRVIDGEPLSTDKAMGMLTTLIFGGFDTTTTLTMNALLWLEDKPQAKARLLADEALMRNALEEFLRAWPPTMGVGRTAARDVEIGGFTIRQGDRVYFSFPSANRDPEVFESPDEIRLDRPNARDHLSFSGGVHKCLGAPLARLEGTMLLREILIRLPNYRIDRTGVRRYPAWDLSAGYLAAPAVFEAA